MPCLRHAMLFDEVAAVGDVPWLYRSFETAQRMPA
jgi:hypothetical protein